MKREEEINKVASKYAQYEVWGSSYDDVWEGFVNGAKWADEHPKNHWHSVADGNIPKVDTDYLFAYDGVIDKGYMREDRSLSLDSEFAPLLDIDDVDYWMEIPELPTE